MSAASRVATRELAVRRPGGPFDPARVGMGLVFTLLALSNLATVVTAVREDSLGWRSGGQLLSGLLNITFCAMVVRAYLRRGSARATDRGAMVRILAAVTTFAPLSLAALEPRVEPSLRTALGLLLTLCGLGVAVAAMKALSTNISVVPQARELADRGPYRLVRHPLYTGEILATAGICLLRGWMLAVLITAALIALQGFRAGREERLLANELPGYRQYAARTRRLLPGVW